MRVVNYQYLSLYGNKQERQLANKILNFHFKRLVRTRRVDNEAIINSKLPIEGLPMTQDYMFSSEESRKEFRAGMRKQSSVVHFVKGLNVAQRDIYDFVKWSFVLGVLGMLVGIFLILSAPMTIN